MKNDGRYRVLRISSVLLDTFIIGGSLPPTSTNLPSDLKIVKISNWDGKDFSESVKMLVWSSTFEPYFPDDGRSYPEIFPRYTREVLRPENVEEFAKNINKGIK